MQSLSNEQILSNFETGKWAKRVWTGLFLIVALFFLLTAVTVTGCSSRHAEHYTVRSQNLWIGRVAATTADGGPAMFEVDGVGGSSAVQPLGGGLVTRLSGYLQNDQLGELSGLAASSTNPGTFWAINDSGNRAKLFALNNHGKNLAEMTLPLVNRDWEDMAAFEYAGAGY